MANGCRGYTLAMQQADVQAEKQVVAARPTFPPVAYGHFPARTFIRTNFDTPQLGSA